MRPATRTLRITAFLLLAPTIANAGSFSSLVSDCLSLLGFRRPGMSPAAIQKLDLSKFSRDVTLPGQDEMLDLEPGTIERWEAEYRAKGTLPTVTGQELFKRESGYEYWTSSLVPTESFQIRAYQAYEELSPLQLTLDTPDVRNRATLDQIDAAFGRLKSNREPIPASTFSLEALCEYAAAFRLPADCVKALRSILLQMSPAQLNPDDWPITLLDEFHSVLKDEKSAVALKKTVSKIDAQIRSGTPTGSTFFDDLYASFLESYPTAAEAYQKSMEAIAVYATAGANVQQRISIVAGALTDPGGIAQMTAVGDLYTRLSLGLSLLDARASARGKPLYSYPKNVKTSLISQEPYHFWMDVYLARKETLATGDPAAGAEAVWLSQIGYQVKSTTTGRDPSRALTTAAFGQPNQKIRLGLAYAANGAHFGANSGKSLASGIYDVDATLRTMLEKGEDLKPMSKTEADAANGGLGIRAFLHWRRVFAPESAFRSGRVRANP